MSELLGKLRNLISEYNLSIIIVHHQGKNEDKGGSLRGSSVISGEYDSLIKIVKDSNNQNKHNLSFDLRHAESPDKSDLFFNPDTYWFETTEKLNAIREILIQEGALSKSELADKLVAKGLYQQKQSTYKPINKAERMVIFC